MNFEHNVFSEVIEKKQPEQQAEKKPWTGREEGGWPKGEGFAKNGGFSNQRGGFSRGRGRGIA